MLNDIDLPHLGLLLFLLVGTLPVILSLHYGGYLARKKGMKTPPLFHPTLVWSLSLVWVVAAGVGATCWLRIDARATEDATVEQIKDAAHMLKVTK